jgi:predicted MPP superfamily phosphohydrolase
VQALKSIKPDAILLPGDILEVTIRQFADRNRMGMEFLSLVSAIAPCYYCYGNHELYNSAHKSATDPSLDEKRRNEIRKMGIHLINDDFEVMENYNAVKIGGYVCGREMPDRPFVEPDQVSKIKELEESKGFKILLCHYPHYYERYFKHSDFDLILSGHAHGGQWRLFGRGIFAPHQGLFPKYTSGIHDRRHIISRGAVNNAKPIPRLFNPCEVLCIDIIHTENTP